MEFSRAPIMARLNDRDYEIGPNGELITSSQEILSDAGRTTERPASSFAFWRRWNNGFSNALGLVGDGNEFDSLNVDLIKLFIKIFVSTGSNDCPIVDGDEDHDYNLRRIDRLQSFLH